MPNIRQWKAAKENPWKWVQSADRVYVGARFLSWKGFPFEFALLGSHAMELYLKAYLIHRTGKYPWGHQLAKIYEECMKLDDFFRDESLAGNFLPISLPDTPENWTHAPWSQLTWTKFTRTLRYPESPFQGRGGAIISTGSASCTHGGTCWALDCIAHFVRQAVPRPKEERDVIDNFLNGSGDIWAASSPPGDLQEIRELFIRGNQFFSQ